ncbi:MAG: type II toxin-antitoxin system prevent-host-death family antitoxin [Dehalococcoidia bacterium]
MKRTVTAVEARRNLGELLEQVYYRGDEIVIERAGKPMATLVPAGRAVAMDISRDESRAWIADWMQRNAELNKDLTEEEVERLVNQEVKAVRAASKRRRAKSA